MHPNKKYAILELDVEWFQGAISNNFFDCNPYMLYYINNVFLRFFQTWLRQSTSNSIVV